MSLFEIIMLVCFGVSWPVSICKSVRTKIVAGKSPLFMLIIMIGYASGMVHKTIYSFDWVIALYAVNLLLVAVDMGCYFYFSRNARVVLSLQETR
ncbi:MAG: hypothetical protein JXA71_12775 [Chitinispirillaceae bacterium]|nr:hypothetical protein [Chitinispirillaceae bacterium]